MATNAFGWNTYDDLKKPSTKAKGGMAIPGWEVPANAGMYGARTTATNAPTAAIPAPSTPAPVRANPAVTEAAAPDARWANAVSGIGPKGEYQFNNASLARAGYDRPEIYNQNVVPAETVGGMVGAMMNPKGDQALSGALRAAAARGDWDAVGRYYASQGQTFGGKMYGDNQDADLYNRAFGSGIRSTKGRERAADMLAARERNQAMLGMTSMQGENARALQEQRQSWETPYKDAEKEQGMRRLAATIAALEQTTKAKAEKPLLDLVGSDAFMRLPKDKQEGLLQQLMADYGGKADGGLIEGYAQGGQVQPVLNPMGNMGMPSSMADLDPAIRQYAQYVSTASQYGLQPVAFPKFIDLLGAARTKLATLPTQGGAVGFAEGGVVDWLKSFLPGVGPLDTPAPATAPAQIDQQRLGQGAAMLGSGMAGQAAQALQGRRSALEEALGAAQGARMGYAGGGAIPVAGQQVFGPGGPKSDSIPAVIDGSRPAALSTGEFVMPTEAVQFFGTDKLNKMIQKARGQ